MTEGSSRRSRRTLLRSGAQRTAVLVALIASTAAIAGAGLARADGPPLGVDQAGLSIERSCSGPAAPGFATCFAERVVGGLALPDTASAVSGYGPADLASAYALPSGLGTGKTVAVVDAYDLPTAESDLGVYRSQFGLPLCTTANGCFRKLNQNGGTTPPAANSGWGQEIALDIDMVSAVCPQCRILLVEASSASLTNLGTAVDQAVAQGAVAVSNSYGGSESSSETSWDTSYYKHPGDAITASSGDSGYGASYPAASPWVTSVGGTSLSRASNARGWTETVWSGAGSGCSAVEPKPSFQHDTVCSRRTIADVSADANPSAGVAVYDTYGSSGWMVFGGTSVASPIIASVYALATPPAPGDYPVRYPYANTGSLFDVTSRSNGSSGGSYLCTGAVGYDGPTGLGTPNGVAAFGPGSAPQNDFSLSVSPGSDTVMAGSGTTAAVSTATTSGSAQSVSLSAGGLPSGASASFSPTSVTSGGSATLTLSTSASTPGGTYPITITGTAASGSHSTTFTLTVSGAPPQNDFSISVSPKSGTVTAGSGTTASVSTATTSGSAQSVSLGTSGLPSGASATFSPPGVTSGGSATVTISTSASTRAGTYPVTITGTAASGSHATTFDLTVDATSSCTPVQKIANPGFESGSASWSATSGVIGQWGSQGQPTHGGSWDAWLDGYGRSHTDTLSQTVAIPSGCSTYTLSFWLHVDSAESTSSAVDTLTVRLGSTTLATYSNASRASGYQQRTFDVAGFAGQTVTLSFAGTENSSRQTSFVLDDLALDAS
jgi:subtilase family serine protease